MAARPILFVVDAGPEIGGGHVMRSLTLAEALADRGAEPVFAASPEVAAVLDAFAGPRVGRAAVPTAGPEGLAAGAAALAGTFDGVVFDHYRLDAAAHRNVSGGRPTLVVDDLADRPLACDLLLDPGPERTPGDYAGLVPENVRLLLGPGYALVRPAFAARRDASLARRGADAPLGRVLVSLGLTDLDGITGRVVGRLLPRLGDAELDVVVGRAAPSLPALEALAARDPRVRLHVEAKDMAALTEQADLAVGAGGSSAWERCTLGVPTVLLVLADNQVPAAEALDRSGAAEVVDARAPDFEAAFDRAFLGLARSPERRARLSARSAAVCDGRGAERVADAFMHVIGA
jgi:UDP-2,4-diacetamido-2,4,6-trideoxy-beta-L-altropyranose hydrolase